jgi:WhiB family redox-sensing transcriptional regulator
MTSVDIRRADVATTAPPDPDWRDSASCKGQLKLFFPPKAERPQARARREAKAKRLCDKCPVFLECRTWARQNREYGYWAGESEEDRYFLGFGVSAPIGVRVRLAREAERESA